MVSLPNPAFCPRVLDGLEVCENVRLATSEREQGESNGARESQRGGGETFGVMRDLVRTLAAFLFSLF